MKNLKFILSFAMLLTGAAAVGAVASDNNVKRVDAATAYFTVEFKTNSSDLTNDLTAGNFANQIISGKEYVTFSSCSKVYAGINGLKFSSSSKNGKLVLNFNQSYEVESITLKAVKYKSDSAKITVGNATAKTLTTSLADYNFAINSTISSVTINATKRLYLNAITVAYKTSEAAQHPITFDANGGTIDGQSTTTVYTKDGENVEYPSDPVRTGYEFAGWYDAPEGGNPVDSLKASGETTLYAHWNENNYYTVYFDAGTNGTCEETQVNVTKGEAIELPEVVADEGFDFDGWYLGNELVGEAGDHYVPTGICTLTAKYSRQEVVVVGQVSEKIVFADESLTDAQVLKTFNLSNITLSFAKGSGTNDPKYYNNGKNARVYKGNTLTISANDEKLVIEKIEFAVSSDYGFKSGLYSVSTGSITGSTWEGSANSIVVKNTTGASDQIRLTAITIYYSALAEGEEVTNVLEFDVNGGTFADPEEWANVEFEGERTVVLPIASDLEATPYKYTNLVGWNDGTTTHLPGAEVVIEKSTKFVAVYAAPELITIAQALEICDITGSSASSIEFTVQGEVKSIKDAYSSSYKNISVYITDGVNEILCYRLGGGETLEVGDTIKVTAALVKYSGTPEFQYGDYELVSKVVKLTSIEAIPAKTEYLVGDEFVKPTVTATYSDGSTADVTAEATFTGYDMATAGTQTVTVTYEGLTDTYEITVAKPDPTLTSIAATPAKTEYLVGEEFEGATVTATYSDETTADVTAEATFTGYDMNTAGEQTVTVTYEGLTTTFTITVSEPLPTPAEKLAEVETRASVGFAYTKTGEEYSFSNVRISWRATVSAELIAELGEITAAGFECSIEGNELVKTINCTESIGTDAEGNTYIFGSLLIPSEVEAKTLITTKAFFEVGGEKVYLQETTHSFETAVKAYLNGAVELTEEQEEALNALAAAYNIVA